MKSLRQYIFENLIIFESQESKSIDAAKKLVMDKFGWDRSKADSFVRNDLRQDLPSLRDVKTAKFILGVTRMFCDGELKDAGTINDLNTTLPYISKDGIIDKWDRNLNGKSAKDIIGDFKSQVDSDNEARRKEVEGETLEGESDYDIVRIDSFEEAERYSKYTSWCITERTGMFNSYTKNGINRFYFCLKKGFKDIQKQPGRNCPLDEYGLSMLAVCVKPDGSLATCTCRWNHDNGGNDEILNEKEISKIINRNFYNVFIPNSKYLKLEHYDSFKKIYDSPVLYSANVGREFYLADENGDLICDTQFDYISNFEQDIATVLLNRKYNYINTKGELLCAQSFNHVKNFSCGFAAVMLNNKWNYINMRFKFISDQWYDKAETFYDGFGLVQLNDKQNYINAKGNLISNIWFDKILGFDYNGYAKVKLDNKFNFINKQGNLIFDDWYEWVSRLPGLFGFKLVRLNDKYNFINDQMKLVSKIWFDFADEDRNKRQAYIVTYQNKIYFMRSDGSLEFVKEVSEY